MSLQKIVSQFEPIINQLPSYCAILDNESKHCLTNQRNLVVTGFQRLEQFVGSSYIDLRCPAAEEWESQTKRDELVRETKQSIDHLCFYTGVDGWHLLYGTRSPLLDENDEVVGTMYNSSDIHQHHLIDISRLMIKNFRYVNGYIKKQFTLTLSNRDVISDVGLSARQLEVLFFILRGQRPKAIGRYLNISSKTVESHIANLNIKFDTILVSQLIEKAIMLGYMNNMPSTLFSKIVSKE